MVPKEHTWETLFSASSLVGSFSLMGEEKNEDLIVLAY